MKVGFSQNEKIVIGEKVSMQSELLGKEMKLSVHLPDAYENSDEHYPVLFTFQTHFEQVSGAVKNLYDNKSIPKTIVVCINNYEYGYLSPTKIIRQANSGQADIFLQFFKDELFPFMDVNYRTHPYRIIFSNSWGAMFGTYAVLAKPEIFDATIASIPWLRYDGDERFILKNTEKFLSSNKYNNFLYLTMDNEDEILPDVNHFVELLKNNPQKGLQWEYYNWPEEDHSSTPYRSIYSGLKVLYEEWRAIPKTVVKQGLAAIKEHELTLKTKFGYTIGVSPIALRMAAMQSKKNNMIEAIAILKYGLEKQPQSVMAHIILGRTYDEAGKLEQAMKTFEKAFELAKATNHSQKKWVKNFLDKTKNKLENK